MTPLTASLVLLLVVGSCAQDSSDHPQMSVSPHRATLDAPLKNAVRGLSPHQRITVRARTTDAQGYVWTSSAVLYSDAGGKVDLGTAAPISCSYHGADAMGL